MDIETLPLSTMGGRRAALTSPRAAIFRASSRSAPPRRRCGCFWLGGRFQSLLVRTRAEVAVETRHVEFGCDRRARAVLNSRSIGRRGGTGRRGGSRRRGSIEEITAAIAIVGSNAGGACSRGVPGRGAARCSPGNPAVNPCDAAGRKRLAYSGIRSIERQGRSTRR